MTDRTMAVVAVVPAAGKGERFSEPAAGLAVSAKLLADVAGEPLLDRTIRSLLDGGVEEVVVVLAPAEHAADHTSAGAARATVRLLTDPRVRIVTNPDPSRGMFSSVLVGIGATGGDPILVLPGDMPFVRSGTVAAVIAACRRTGQIVSPRCDGRRGHPIGLPGSLRDAILRADPSATLATVLGPQEANRCDVDVSDRGVLRDVDVVGDLVS